ncbi:class I SAM-dependent methyltransferase [Candidatus Leptofilum sp.]|uniref:class I SAM-dependent methyltransferase n=1 Tax=Candidatus Leptofilum sp. TaxID=3241576 RepID=UPI003B5C41BB
MGKEMEHSQEQGNLWGAQAWDWTYLFEPMSKPLWTAMLDSANVQAGTEFIDLGCGGGGASLLAAQRGAHVSGLDAADALIQIAHKRLPRGDFRVGDLESLPFNDNRFDVTFSSLSLMFANNWATALSEMKRVTSSGERVTIGIWGVPEDCEYRHILKAIANTLPFLPTGSGPFALSERNLLENMMITAGLEILERGDVSVPFQFSDFETMWRTVNSVGPMQAAKQLVSEETLKTAILQATQPFQADNGNILFNNRLKYVTAVA